MKSSKKNKAIEFIFLVKQRFVNQSSKFDEFVKLVTSPNRTQWISQLKTLFADHHPDLLLGLNQFLPYDMEDHLFVESNRVFAHSLPMPAKKSGLLCKGGSGDGECSLYEDTMDVKEFYLFEMDMAFWRLESTIKKLEGDPESLEDCFTALDGKCIKKLYSEDGDDGLGEDMIRILQSDPVGRLVARVVVLERLRQKQAQLKQQKNELDKVWNEIFQDIREKGRVLRHRDFLQRTIKASTNGFVTKKKGGVRIT